MRAVLASVALLVAAVASAGGREGIPIQYMDPHHRNPSPASLSPAFSEERPAYSRVVAVPAGSGPRGNLIAVIVDSGVYPDIQAAVATYVADLAVDGFSAEVWQVTGGTAASIRADLQAEYAGGNLYGAVLVGNLPAGWMESYEGQYPMDLYYMDMNGTWTDADANGLFEQATNWAPEIFVGRLTPTWLSCGTSAELLENYFAKNHAYRSGTLTLPDRALAYEEAFTGLTGYLSLAYSTVVTKSSPSGTTADDFRSELLNGYEWVHLIAHSSPWGSSFHVGAPPSGAGTINDYEIIPLDPHAFFYVLNCCTNGRWTEIDNMANMYIWADTYGLVAIAQAKTDYTNDFYELYSTLASGTCIGEAFRAWLGANLDTEHAAVLLGDPTLRPHGNGTASSIPGQTPPGELEAYWPASLLTSGIHSEGDLDACIDPSSGEVFSAFGTSEAVRANILATHSTSDTWISPMQVCEHEYWDWHPSVGTDGQGKIWVAWHSMNENIYGYDIYVSTWTGSGWAAATQLTNTDAFEVEPSVAGGNGKGWVVWQQWAGGESDIDGRMWTGTAWTTATAVAGLDGDERVPDLAFSNGTYGLVYQAQRAGDLIVCFRDAPDSGPFGTETALSASGGDCREPAIAGDGAGGFWVAWEQDGTIRARHGGAGGWDAEAVLSASGMASRPAVSCFSGMTTAVAWIENGTSVTFALHDSGGWGPASTGAVCPATESVALAYEAVDRLTVLYGSRDASLHWDIWAATSDPTGIGSPGESGSTALSIRPLANPCGGPSVLLDLSAAAEATISVWDLSGRVLRSFQADPGQVCWDRRDASGTPVPSGLYFVTAICGSSGSRCSVVLLD